MLAIHMYFPIVRQSAIGMDVAGGMPAILQLLPHSDWNHFRVTFRVFLTSRRLDEILENLNASPTYALRMERPPRVVRKKIPITVFANSSLVNSKSRLCLVALSHSRTWSTFIGGIYSWSYRSTGQTHLPFFRFSDQLQQTQYDTVLTGSFVWWHDTFVK